MTTHHERSVDSPLSRLMLALEEAGGLDAAVAALQPLLDTASASPAARDALRGTWLGHALHPLLVMVPIGTWTSATLLDVAGPDDGAGAELLVAVGVLSTIPSVLTGLAELSGTGRRERRVGAVHAAANAAGLGLQAASWAARRAGRPTLGKLASAAGLAAVGAGGYLGGHLSVSRGVGSHDRAFDAN